MKITWDALLYEPEGAGIGRYIKELVGAYSVTFPNDEITAVVMEGQELPGPRHLVPVPFVHQSPQRLWFEQIHLGPLVRKNGYDVVHFGDYQMPIINPLSRAIVTVHDLVAFKFPQLFPKNMGHLKRFLMRHSVIPASHIIVPSEATAEDLQTILRVESKKISVIPHGVAPVLERLTAERLYPRPYFLAVGTVEPRKNFERLIAAFAKRFRDQPDGPDLLIAGKPGWLYGNTMNASIRYEITQRVKFLGFVSDPDLEILYRDAMAVVYPSLYEGFGFPAAEALIRSKPLLCSTGGALEEVAKHDALLIDPYQVASIAEGLDALWRDIAPWQHRAYLGSQRLAEMTWSQAAAKTRLVYQHVSGEES